MKEHFSIFVLLLFAIVGFRSQHDVHVPRNMVMSQPTQVELFMEKIASIETPDGGYHTVNKFGMLGRYQFSPRTIQAVGIQATRQQFLINKELQDTAMVRLMEMNERLLADHISKFDGRIIKGVKITRASILAGAHFAGANGVKQFLTNNDYFGTIDGLGTSLRTYMAQFSDFQLPPLRG